MKILIISDIHANHCALHSLLRAVRADETLQFDEVRCLGDIFGYYSHPVQAWQTVYELDPKARIGNHDLLLTLMGQGRSYAHLKSNHRALISTAWHSQTVKEAGLWPQIEAWYEMHLCAPLDILVERGATACRLVFVHGAPHVAADGDKAGYSLIYMHPRTDLGHEFRATLKQIAEDYPPPEGGRTIVFIGHTHTPTIASLHNEQLKFYPARYITPGQSLSPDELVFQIEEHLSSEEKVVIVNGGSITFQRDGVQTNTARAHAVLLDTELLTLRFIKVNYNHNAVAINMPLEMSVLDENTRHKLDAEIHATDRENRYAGKSIHDIWEQARTDLIGWLLLSPPTSKIQKNPELRVYDYSEEGFALRTPTR